MTEESKGSSIPIQLEKQLTDTQWQKGLAWRKEKVEAVAKARRLGINDNTIFRILKRCGLTTPTANRIMDDASYFDEIAEEEPFIDYAYRKKREKEKEGKK